MKKKLEKSRINAISLFSCIGVGEFYLDKLGIDIILASDIDEKRCKVHKFYYPETEIVCGDICQKEIKQEILNKIKNKKIDLLIVTPPCQGMSSVGKNRKDSILHSDKRNFLIFETFDIIDEIKPNYIVFENVTRLLKIKFDIDGETKLISELLNDKYGKDYHIKINKFNAMNFEVPQDRERVFIRMYKKGLSWKDPIESKTIYTVKDAIGNLPSLDSGEVSNIKNHWARKHPQNQIKWLTYTPTGKSAFDNKLHYPSKENGERIKGFKNCYKRIEWDKPSPTITMRNEIMSSQGKVHPGRHKENGLWSDARVLTLRELLILMSMPPDLDIPTFVSDTEIRQFIGEGIPSKLLFSVMQGLGDE